MSPLKFEHAEGHSAVQVVAVGSGRVGLPEMFRQQDCEVLVWTRDAQRSGYTGCGQYMTVHEEMRSVVNVQRQSTLLVEKHRQSCHPGGSVTVLGLIADQVQLFFNPSRLRLQHLISFVNVFLERFVLFSPTCDVA
jgi:hypothetical protein